MGGRWKVLKTGKREEREMEEEKWRKGKMAEGNISLFY